MRSMTATRSSLSFAVRDEAGAFRSLREDVDLLLQLPDVDGEVSVSVERSALLHVLERMGRQLAARITHLYYYAPALVEQVPARLESLRWSAVQAQKMAEPPHCAHGEWTFAGADYKRRATKWRCPTGECQPGSMWVKADRLHPLVPRESKRFKDLYRSRSAVEREFGRLKHEWALLPLRVRGLDRVRLHADLTILAKLSCALVRARALPLVV
jgi:hypothetical protein